MEISKLITKLGLRKRPTLVRLTLIDGGNSTQEYSIETLPIMVGRSPQADIRLKDVWVSGVHCRIENERGVIMIRDLESRNGTVLNGSLVEERELRVGDEIQIGMSRVRVDYLDANASMTTS